MDVFIGRLRLMRFVDAHNRPICRAHYQRIGGFLGALTL